jgi:hypothetical protein
MKEKRFEVLPMKWIIRAGSPVEENKRHEITFHHDYLVSKDTPLSATVNIMQDSESDEAPVYPGGPVRKLATLEADFSHFSGMDLKPTMQKRPEAG